MSEERADTTVEQAIAKEREQWRRRVLSAISHELRTPLTSIIGALEIHDQMKDTLSADKKQALLDAALHEAYRLDRFVNNILEMAPLEQGGT